MLSTCLLIPWSLQRFYSKFLRNSWWYFNFERLEYGIKQTTLECSEQIENGKQKLSSNVVKDDEISFDLLFLLINVLKFLFNLVSEVTISISISLNYINTTAIELVTIWILKLFNIIINRSNWVVEWFFIFCFIFAKD